MSGAILGDIIGLAAMVADGKDRIKSTALYNDGKCFYVFANS